MYFTSNAFTIWLKSRKQSLLLVIELSSCQNEKKENVRKIISSPVKAGAFFFFFFYRFWNIEEPEPKGWTLLQKKT